MRWMLAAAALLLGALLAWVLGDRPGAPTRLTPGSSSIRVLEAPPAAPDPPRQSAVAGKSLPATRERPGASPTSATLHVVRADDGPAVAEADVWYADEADLDADELRRLLDFFVAPEPALAELGRHGRSDAGGELRVPSPETKLHVLAQRGTLWNYATFETPGATELEIALREDTSLVVETVDPRGHPQGGIPVELRVPSWMGGPDCCWKATTDPITAQVELPHVHWFLKRQKGMWDEQYFFLCAGFPAKQCAEVRLGPEDVPESPVRLAIGEVGALTVQVVDRDGRPWTRCGNVGITLPVTNTRDFSQALDDAGRATFRVVEVGTPVRVFVHGNDRTLQNESVSYPGPARAGQHEELTVMLGRPALGFQGTVQSSDGAPLGSTELRLGFRLAGMADTGTRARVTTAPDGTFQTPLFERPPVDREWTLEIWQADSRDPWGQHALRRAAFPVGSTWTEGVWDLGVFSLDDVPLAAAGRVVDDAGEPVEDTEVSLLRTGSAFSRVSTHSDGAGEFRLHAETELEVVDLQATGRGLEPASRKVPRGTSTATLVLPRSHRRHARGTVLLDEDQDPQGLRVRWEDQERAVERDGTFTVSSEAAAVDVTVRVRGEVEPLYRQSAVPTFAPPEEADPLSIDLRGKLRRLDFRAVEADGTPVRSVDLVAWTPGHPAERVDVTDAFGKATLLTSRVWICVALLEEGHRLALLGECASGQTVTLYPAYSVVLHTGGVSLPAKPVFLWPVLEFQAGPGDSLAQQVTEHVGSPWAFSLFGSLDLLVPVPGCYRVHWTLRSPSLVAGDEEPVSDPVELEVRDTDRVQEFRVPLAAEDLARGLQRLRERDRER